MEVGCISYEGGYAWKWDVLVAKGICMEVGCISYEGGYAGKLDVLVAKGDMHGSGMY